MQGDRADRAVKECGSPGGGCSRLHLSRAQIASACWLISVGAALLWQILLCAFPEVAGCQKYGGGNSILVGNKLTTLAFLEFSADFNDTSFITFFLIYFVPSEA